jgi:hypothetical protein
MSGWCSLCSYWQAGCLVVQYMVAVTIKKGMRTAFCLAFVGDNNLICWEHIGEIFVINTFL